MQRLLIVEDNSQFAESIKTSVCNYFETEVCSSVSEAIRLLHSRPYDVLLCDYILGVSNGLDIVENAKDMVSSLRVVIMTAFAEKDMAIKALNLGVAHLLQKPFSIKELRSALLGAKGIDNSTDQLTRFCPITNTVLWKGQSIYLTPSEYLIFSYLVSKKNKWVSRGQLNELLWSATPHVSRNLLDTHIYNLRKKIPGLNELLSVVRGKGFSLNSLE